MIGAVPISLPHRVGACDRRLFDDPKELEGEVAGHFKPRMGLGTVMT